MRDKQIVSSFSIEGELFYVKIVSTLTSLV